jgi:hypothetical protein
MTIKKLLTGVALTALAAGAAHAQTVTLGAGQIDNQSVVDSYTGTIAGTLILPIAFSNDLTTFGAAPNELEITFTFTNATLTAVATGAYNNGANTANCDFSTLVGGGGITNFTATFESTGNLQACDESATGNDDGAFTFNVDITDPTADASVTVSYTVVDVNGGTYTAPANQVIQIFDTVPTPAFTVAAGVDGAGQFSVDGLTLEGTGIIGTLSLGALAGGAQYDRDNAITTADDLYANTSSMTITFPGGTAGLSVPSVGGAACGAAAGNVHTCVIPAANLPAFGGSVNITVASDGDPLDAVAGTQIPQAGAGTFVGDANISNNTSAAIALEEIRLNDGRLETPLVPVTRDNFSWVRIGSGGTESNFRLNFDSDAEAAAVERIDVLLSDGNGVTGGTVQLTPGTVDTGFRVQGSTITFNSRALGAASGQTGNANVESITLRHIVADLAAADAEAAEVLRQLVNRSTATFVATPGLPSDNN